jgi:hypothetical protein
LEFVNIWKYVPPDVSRPAGSQTLTVRTVPGQSGGIGLLTSTPTFVPFSSGCANVSEYAPSFT